MSGRSAVKRAVVAGNGHQPPNAPGASFKLGDAVRHKCLPYEKAVVVAVEAAPEGRKYEVVVAAVPGGAERLTTLVYREWELEPYPAEPGTKAVECSKCKRKRRYPWEDV